ncbi:phage major capsid protein [Metabacillus indicus]|uniref:phage major capsid protein n=1 Tax=Metabacillus indicus TaxID=246786 RepID=UPI002E238E04|nr:phage major capsid protein [Metabacillus indicus]
MEEISPIFGRARKFPSVNGTLKIPRESALADEAGFVGEGNSVSELEIGLEEITLNQKRVGAALRLSNQLIHDAAVDTVGYVQEMLARKTVAAVEKSMLTGNAEEEFRGIVHDVTVPNFHLEAAATDLQKLDKLLELYLSIHPAYHGEACYIMSRTFYNEISKMKDKNGNFYIQNGTANGKPTKTLFGAEVLVSQNLEYGTVPCVFGNIEQSYAIMVKQGPKLQKVVDTDNALKGLTGFVYDSYLDGQVYNPQAIAKLTTV